MRGVPPGAAQAAVGAVLCVLAGVVGLQRGQLLLAVVFLALAAVPGATLVRLFRR
jgi:hypothetical protein